MNKLFKYFLAGSIITGLLSIIFSGFAVPEFENPLYSGSFPENSLGIQDSITDDTLPDPKEDYSKLPNDKKKKSFTTGDPSNVESSVEYDRRTGKFVLKEKIGAMDKSRPVSLSFEDYRDYQIKNATQNYWKERAALDNAKDEGGNKLLQRLVSQNIKIPVPGFDMIFGSNQIKIEASGYADLSFGINISKVENPILPEDLQKTVNFDFDEKIKMGVTGQIGDKMKLGINYDTEATFDFENQTKLAYEGDEDEIIQKIEAGNVSLPLNGSLITGSQSLFGFKTELKFGKLYVTSVISQQKGEMSTIEVEGGAMTTDYKITADEYEANRHYFLSHYFRDRYNEALSGLPVIRSAVNITRIEVWVTNRTGDFTNARNIVSFIDLGESGKHIYSDKLTGSGVYPNNNSNQLYENIKTIYSGIRDINNVTGVLNGIMESGKEYDKVQNARLLSENDYSYNPSLGYISLRSSLNADEVLAVAYEYTAGGKTYKVGEFSTDNINAPQTLILKTIKASTLSTKMPTWDLMMKNVYSIGTYQLNPEEFKMEVMYRNDKTGSSINYIPEGKINGQILIKVLGLDNLNKQNEPGPDGYFDFIDQVTISSSTGKIYFPVLEPFGKDLRKAITGGKDDPELNRIADQYVFEELYTETQSSASQKAEKNKFFIEGTYSSAGGSEISLNAMNVPEGSVTVTAGGQELVENQDYTVNYNMGTVTILNHSLLESGTPIKISLENQSMFNIGTKTLFGTHLDYRFSERFNIGGTFLHLNEKPLTNKVAIGAEPISNSIWGLDGNYNTEVALLTKLIDKIPLIETKEKSTFDFTGEFAQFVPGHPKVIGKNGESYIDDFEGTKTTLDLKAPTAWRLASTPQFQPKLFPEANVIDSLVYGYNRARLSWYAINSDFLRNTGSTPSHITADDQSNHLVREIYEKEIFPNRDPVNGIPPVLSVLNLAYYPAEKGPYNYDTYPTDFSDGVDANGNLINTETRWAGMMRDLTTNDFEEANIEFIEFWMLDPFIYDSLRTGGDLYFNLGNISEDILRDSRQSFENGFPKSVLAVDVDSTAWGRVPMLPRITDGFANEPKDARQFQDVGLDGLSDTDESTFYGTYLNRLISLHGQSSKAYTDAMNDPSNDNYMFFKAAEYDAARASILDRYKLYINPEANSAIPETGSETATASQQLPDMEDINKDYTLNETEAYFQYRIHISPEEMEIGKNYITNIMESDPELVNKKHAKVRWYQFKVPIADFTERVGGIEDFKSIRFVRMFMTGWDKEIVLRFAEMDLVRGEWRKYTNSMIEGGEAVTTPEITNATFDISAVNIEENASREPVNYVLPPGTTREISPNEPQLRELNEQAISLRVGNLDEGDARAAYKNISMDVRQFKKIQMYIHAEACPGERLEDDQVSAFIRIGSDYKENYYEYEIPLKVTPEGYYDINSEEDKKEVWRKENMLDLEFEIFQTVKQRRNNKMRETGSDNLLNSEYFEIIDGRRVSIVGNPNLSNVRTIMIGVRNRSQESNYTEIDNGMPVCAEIWMNELRLTEFNENGGWAAQGRASTKLADFATLALAGNISTPGFGSIEKKVSERQQSTDYGYDASVNMELGKFFPKHFGVNIPTYLSYSEGFSNPEYNPLDPDILFSTALSDPNMTAREKDSIRFISQDYIERKSINFTNVKIDPQKKQKIDLGSSEKKTPEEIDALRKKNQQEKMKETGGSKRFYHVSNWTASYGYNQTFIRNINTKQNILRQHTGSLAYNFTNNPTPIEPFKRTKSKILKKKSFALIRDINFYYAPILVAFRNDLNKSYNEIELRNIDNPNILIDPNFTKDFTWQRVYDVKYKLTKGITLDYTATNSAWVDEPFGRIDKGEPDFQEKRDTLWNNLKDFGRTSKFNQEIKLAWRVPIEKVPLLDWTSLDFKYGARYDWQLGPVTEDSIEFGNQIMNNQVIDISPRFQLSKLYTKVKYLKKVDESINKKQKKPEKEDVSFKKENMSMKAGKPSVITHNLKTKDDVKVTVKDSKGTVVQGITEVVDDNKVTFIPKNDADNASVEVTGKKEVKLSIPIIITNHILYSMMAVKNISIQYNENNGTSVPGFLPGTRFLGFDNKWDAPGYGFLLGEQDPNYAYKAATKGWLSGDSLILAGVNMAKDVSIRVRAVVEPIKDLRIDVTAERNTLTNFNEFWIEENGRFVARNSQYVQSSFSTSFLSIKTTFGDLNRTSYTSKAFDVFMENRIIIANRMATGRTKIPGENYNPAAPNITDLENGTIATDGFPNGYNPTSQEVLIPAFLAAYAGQSAAGISTSPFTKIPMPNWRAKYEGLSNIEFVKKYFSKIILDHGYLSTYSVSNYQSNLAYDFDSRYTDGFSFIREELSGMFIPEYEIEGINIDEKFVPLIGIDMKWVNKLSTKFEYKKTRNIALSFANNQIFETHNEEYVFGVGYTIEKLPLNLMIGGSPKKFESPLVMRLDFAFRDDLVIVRRIAENNIELQKGGKNTTANFTAEYELNDTFTLKLFYDQVINTPRVSTNFRTVNTKIGFSIRFNLLPK